MVFSSESTVLRHVVTGRPLFMSLAFALVVPIKRLACNIGPAPSKGMSNLPPFALPDSVKDRALLRCMPQFLVEYSNWPSYLQNPLQASVHENL